MRCDSVVAQINPGEFYVTRGEERISTVLGSCVSACIWSPQVGIGGMNHFMLPLSDGDVSSTWKKIDAKNASTRYGDFAMERLVNELIKYGANRLDLRVKLVGGGMMWASEGGIGQRNIEFAQDYVRRENLRLEGSDLGLPVARRVLFDPRAGRVKVKKLASDAAGALAKRERTYKQQIATKPVAGEIDLF
ncbi:MAG: chemoreceptor glutamine deamidase CheD [Deltaproteobacteria bacterium]